MKRSGQLRRKTELKRGTKPLRRRKMIAAIRPPADVLRTRAEWRATQIERCALCWTTYCWRGIHLAHIVGGSGKVEHPANYVLICGVDHSHQHFGGECGRPKVTLGMLLTAKLQADPSTYDERVILKALGRKRLLGDNAPAPIPQFFLDLRHSHERLSSHV